MASIVRRIIGRLWGGGGLSRVPGIQTGEAQQRESASPATVTFDTAMQLSAVWASARLITETIAMQPLRFYRRQDKERIVDTDSDLARLFAGKVNRYQNRVEFFETFLLNLVLHGNAYALKQFDERGRIIGLLPLMSSQVHVEVLDDGSVLYVYYNNGKATPISDAFILHTKIFGNGIVGLSPLSYARNTIGIGLAGESQVANIFSDGGKPTGVLMVDELLTPEQKDRLRKEFKMLREGPRNYLAVLEKNTQYQQISLSPQDIQLLESRRFQIEDIARFFGIQSFMINDTQASTSWGSGIHEIMKGFQKITLQPYAVRIAESLRMGCIEPGIERDTTEIEFDFSPLTVGNKLEQFRAYATAINAGIMTPNEARDSVGLEPREEGDTLIANGNMVPIEDLRMLMEESNAN